MRELKCKAWDRHKQKMGKVTGIIFSDSQHTLVRYQFIDERGRKIDEQSHIDEKGHGVVALLWYTGLKDKNGKEIYEGDIVRWKEIVADYETHYGPNIPTPTNEYTERVDTRVQTFTDNVVFVAGCFRLSRDAENDDEAFWTPTNFPSWYGCGLNMSNVDIEHLTEDDYFKEFGYETIDELIKDVTSGIEIIGNIYENPELLNS